MIVRENRVSIIVPSCCRRGILILHSALLKKARAPRMNGGRKSRAFHAPPSARGERISFYTKSYHSSLLYCDSLLVKEHNGSSVSSPVSSRAYLIGVFGNREKENNIIIKQRPNTFSFLLALPYISMLQTLCRIRIL